MNDRARNILSLILLGIGTILLVSLLMLYWFIHGEYERYIWIINGPFPFSNFGSGPFQMGMYGELFLIGALLIVAAFGIWKQKKLVSTIAFASIAVPIALGVTSLSSFMYLYSVKDTTPAPTLDSTEFASKIQNFVVQNFGQPIDSGFTAPMYLRAFPGLLEADFDGVETSEGRYKYSDGELAFTKTPTGRYSTFDEAILEKGHKALFDNVRMRFGSDFSVDEIISRISRFEENRARLYENCAKAEIPNTELDTTLDRENKIAVVRWRDGEKQQDIKLKLPYYPETNFEGCSESAKRVLRHLQEVPRP